MPDTAAVELLTSTSSAGVVGLCTPEGEPWASRCWGASVLSDDPLRLRVLLPTGSLARVGRHPGDGSRWPVALTMSDVLTLRGVQAKGTAHSLEAATEADLVEFERKKRSLFDAIYEVDGYPPELLARWPPTELCAATVEVEALFDQTPGPDAGAPLDPAGL